MDDVTDGVLVRLHQFAITGTVFPPAEASTIIARRNRTVLVLPRRTIRWSFCPSCSVSLRTLTGPAIEPPHTDRTCRHIQPAQGQSAPPL